MATVKDSYTTTTGEAPRADVYASQAFTPTESYKAVSGRYRHDRSNGAPQIVITMGLFASDGSSHPTGTALTTGTVTIPAEGGNGGDVAWYSVTFNSQITLNSGTKYCLQVHGFSGGAGANYIYQPTDTDDPQDLFAVGGDGASWSDLGATECLIYEVWGNPLIPTDAQYTRNLVTFAGNKVKYGSDPTAMTELTAANGDIDCTQPLSAHEAYGKVFIANGTKLKVADFVNTKLPTADILGGAGIPNFRTVLTGGSSSAVMVVDYIDSASGSCNIYGRRTTGTTFTNGETVTGTNDAGQAVSFAISSAEVAAPHWYDWTVYAGDTATYGTMPTQAYKVFLSQGRISLAVDNVYPHQWYMPRQENPWDWIYGVDDAQSAVAGNDADAGEVGDIIIDVFSYKDEYVVYGCASTYWYLTGNPCQGGTLKELDLTAGLLGAGGWCWDDSENLWTVSTKGLSKILPGFAGIEVVTKLSYPDFVKDLAFNRTTDRLTMSFDRDRYGILLTKTTLLTGANVNWWYSLASGGLFKETYPAVGSVYSALYFEADDPDDKTLLLGCNDGYIRKFDPDAKSDDSGATDTAIDSWVSFGPIPMSNSPRSDGTLSNIEVITGGTGSGGAEDSDSLTLTVFADRTAEKVIKSSVDNTDTKLTKTIIGPGLSRGDIEKRRARGKYGMIKIRNSTAAQSWALESMSFATNKKGKVR